VIEISSACMASFTKLCLRKRFVCMQGLITKERKNLDPAAAPFAKDIKDVEGLREGASLLEVVKLTRT
jgi:malate dehydrogenase (decarboxylating)